MKKDMLNVMKLMVVLLVVGFTHHTFAEPDHSGGDRKKIREIVDRSGPVKELELELDKIDKAKTGLSVTVKNTFNPASVSAKGHVVSKEDVEAWMKEDLADFAVVLKLISACKGDESATELASLVEGYLNFIREIVKKSPVREFERAELVSQIGGIVKVLNARKEKLTEDGVKTSSPEDLELRRVLFAEFKKLTGGEDWTPDTISKTDEELKKHGGAIAANFTVHMAKASAIAAKVPSSKDAVCLLVASSPTESKEEKEKKEKKKKEEEEKKKEEDKKKEAKPPTDLANTDVPLTGAPKPGDKNGDPTGQTGGGNGGGNPGQQPTPPQIQGGGNPLDGNQQLQQQPFNAFNPFDILKLLAGLDNNNNDQPVIVPPTVNPQANKSNTESPQQPQQQQQPFIPPQEQAQQAPSEDSGQGNQNQPQQPGIIPIAAQAAAPSSNPDLGMAQVQKRDPLPTPPVFANENGANAAAAKELRDLLTSIRSMGMLPGAAAQAAVRTVSNGLQNFASGMRGGVAAGLNRFQQPQGGIGVGAVNGGSSMAAAKNLRPGNGQAASIINGGSGNSQVAIRNESNPYARDSFRSTNRATGEQGQIAFGNVSGQTFRTKVPASLMGAQITF